MSSVELVRVRTTVNPLAWRAVWRRWARARGDVFFEGAAGEGGAVIGCAVGGVDEDEVRIGGGGDGLWFWSVVDEYGGGDGGVGGGCGLRGGGGGEEEKCGAYWESEGEQGVQGATFVIVAGGWGSVQE